MAAESVGVAVGSAVGVGVGFTGATYTVGACEGASENFPPGAIQLTCTLLGTKFPVAMSWMYHCLVINSADIAESFTTR